MKPVFSIFRKCRKMVVLLIAMLVFSMSAAFSDETEGDITDADVANAVDAGEDEFNCGYPDDPEQFITKWSKRCWFCTPLNSIIKVIQEVAADVYKNVRDGMVKLLAACFMIWLAIKVLGYVAAMNTKDVGEFYTMLGTGALRVLIAYVALMLGTGIWEYLVTPLASAVFDYGSAAMKGTGLSMDGSTTETSAVTAIGEKIIGTGATAGGLMTEINEHLMRLITTGWVVVSAAMKEGRLCFPGNKFSMFLSGLPLIAMGVVFLFAIPVRCVDICFRFGMFLILLPMFIFAWAFPLTRKFTSQGLDLLTNTMLTLLLLAITVAICTKLVINTLDLPFSMKTNFKENMELLEKHYALDLTAVVTVIAFLIFAYVILNNIPDMANRLGNIAYDSSGIAEASSVMLKSVIGWGAAAAVGGVKVGGAGGQAAIRRATRGTAMDASVRSANKQGQAQSIANQWMQQQQPQNTPAPAAAAAAGGAAGTGAGAGSGAGAGAGTGAGATSGAGTAANLPPGGGSLAQRNAQGGRQYNMPPDLAAKFSANPNYQMTGKEIDNILRANRSTSKGLKGFAAGTVLAAGDGAMEGLFSKLTGEKASDFYPQAEKVSGSKPESSRKSNDKRSSGRNEREERDAQRRAEEEDIQSRQERQERQEASQNNQDDGGIF